MALWDHVKLAHPALSRRQRLVSRRLIHQRAHSNPYPNRPLLNLQKCPKNLKVRGDIRTPGQPPRLKQTMPVIHARVGVVALNVGGVILLRLCRPPDPHPRPLLPWQFSPMRVTSTIAPSPIVTPSVRSSPFTRSSRVWVLPARTWRNLNNIVASVNDTSSHSRFQSKGKFIPNSNPQPNFSNGFFSIKRF